MTSEQVSLVELDGVIESTLDSAELGYEKRAMGDYVVTLPGVKKLRTVCSLALRGHALEIEAFVCRRPDEEHAKVYRFLLRRNAKLYGVHYTVDASGDVYLVGRLGFAAVTATELDKILGQVLEAADGDFNTLLQIGFAGSIRREWAWRVSRGESLANLRAFSHLIDSDDRAGRLLKTEADSGDNGIKGGAAQGRGSRVPGPPR